MITDITKGDSISLELSSGCPFIDITGWKIRAKLTDGCNCIKLATTNAGGSDDEIKIITPSQGIFDLYVAEGATSCFQDKACIQIEVETDETVGGKPEIVTIFDQDILFKNNKVKRENF